MVTANAQAPGGVEVAAPASPPSPARPRRRRSTCSGRHVDGRAADAARPRRRALAPPAAAGAGASCRGRQPARLPRHARRRRLHRGPHPEDRRQSATESGANVFPARLLRPAGLPGPVPAVLQAALVGVFERVYEVGPVFRAEPHDTVRHLAEYISPRRRARLHPRPPRRRSRCCARSLAGMVGRGRASTPAPRSTGSASTLPAVPAEIPVVHFRDAPPPGSGPTRATSRTSRPEHERALGGVGPARSTAATCSPSRATRCASGRSTPTRSRTTPRSEQQLRPALPRRSSWSPAGSACTATATTSAALEARGESTRRRYAAYLEAFAHGMPPHGGFAIGLERWTARLVEAVNIREVTLFPRDLHRLAP